MELRFVALIALMAILGQGAAKDKSPGKLQHWEPAGEQTVSFTSWGNLPADSAGCLAVGYYILGDGTVAKPRIMQGAYTKQVPDEVQKQFADAVSVSAGRWKFRYKNRYVAPHAVFDWTVVGFDSDGSHAVQAILGPESQSARVRSSCEITNLGEWGSAHAISVGEAGAAKDRGILMPDTEPVEAFWADAIEKTPPRYPPIAYHSGVEGCVLVGMLISHEGRPEGFRIVKTEVTRSTPQIRKALEDASLSAASAWRFAPGPDNPERLPAFVQIPVDYALDEPSAKRCDPVSPTELRSAGG